MKMSLRKISTLMLAFCFSVGMLFPATWAFAAMKTNINTATIEQLEAVNGVGHDTAQNIVDYKKEHGQFKNLQELEQVKGVGKVRLQALSQAFTVGAKKSSKTASAKQ